MCTNPCKHLQKAVSFTLPADTKYRQQKQPWQWDKSTLASTCLPDLYEPSQGITQRTAGRSYENSVLQERFQGARSMVARCRNPVFNNNSKCSMKSRRKYHHLAPWAMQGTGVFSSEAMNLTKRENTPRGEISWITNLWTQPTCRTVPARGSISRIFLSLQAVARRLPTLLNDMERTTSLWASRTFTGFEMIASLLSRFQIMIWGKRMQKKKKKSALCCLNNHGICVPCSILPLFSTYIGLTIITGCSPAFKILIIPGTYSIFQGECLLRMSNIQISFATTFYT